MHASTSVRPAVVRSVSLAGGYLMADHTVPLPLSQLLTLSRCSQRPRRATARASLFKIVSSTKPWARRRPDSSAPSSLPPPPPPQRPTPRLSFPQTGAQTRSRHHQKPAPRQPPPPPPLPQPTATSPATEARRMAPSHSKRAAGPSSCPSASGPRPPPPRAALRQTKTRTRTRRTQASPSPSTSRNLQRRVARRLCSSLQR